MKFTGITHSTGTVAGAVVVRLVLVVVGPVMVVDVTVARVVMANNDQLSDVIDDGAVAAVTALNKEQLNEVGLV